MRPLVKMVWLLSAGLIMGCADHSGGHRADLDTNGRYIAPARENKISVHFSPKQGCTDAICNEIRSAKKTIRMQAYSFTSKAIAAALVDARRRGVKVVAIVDHRLSTEPGNKSATIAEAGAEVYVDSAHAIAHNKIILIDSDTIITGSFNFTNQAENSNAENLLIIHDMPDLFAAYEKNFLNHLHHAARF